MPPTTTVRLPPWGEESVGSRNTFRTIQLTLSLPPDSDGYEFSIVSLDNKQWHFEASSQEERDDWVAAIEQQILFSLQGNESNKSRARHAPQSDPLAISAIKNQVSGNLFCADCENPSKKTGEKGFFSFFLPRKGNARIVATAEKRERKRKFLIFLSQMKRFFFLFKPFKECFFSSFIIFFSFLEDLSLSE